MFCLIALLAPLHPLHRIWQEAGAGGQPAKTGPPQGVEAASAGADASEATAGDTVKVCGAVESKGIEGYDSRRYLMEVRCHVRLAWAGWCAGRARGHQLFNSHV